jgi:hypothetical protein
VKYLLDVVKIDDETIGGWWSKADVADWAEMTADQIGKCIEFIEKKIPTTTATK